MSDAGNRGKELVLLLDSGEMRTLDPGAATGIRFLDSAVQRQFADYLRVVAQARSKEKRSVYLDSTSTAARALTASYMIPFPVWKSSYRLMATTAGTMLVGRLWTTRRMRIGECPIGFGVGASDFVYQPIV